MSLKRKVGSGRPTKIATRCNIAKIVRKFNHRSGCSQRKVAWQLNTSLQYISYILKHRTEIRCHKKQKKPAMAIKQKKAARPKCKKLAEMYAGYEFVLDNESFFTKSNSNLSGNDQFYSDNLALPSTNLCTVTNVWRSLWSRFLVNIIHMIDTYFGPIWRVPTMHKQFWTTWRAQESLLCRENWILQMCQSVVQ